MGEKEMEAEGSGGHFEPVSRMKDDDDDGLFLGK